MSSSDTPNGPQSLKYLPFAGGKEGVRDLSLDLENEKTFNRDDARSRKGTASDCDSNKILTSD